MTGRRVRASLGLKLTHQISQYLEKANFNNSMLRIFVTEVVIVTAYFIVVQPNYVTSTALTGDSVNSFFRKR